MAKKKKTKKQKKTKSLKRVNVRIVGVGGGGGSIVSKIARKIKGVSFYAVDTDDQALGRLSRKVKKIRVGEEQTHGLGTGMDTELAKKTIQEEEVKKIFDNQDIVILVGCLGGGFASGTSSILSGISLKMGKITYGVFTLPFDFEGKKKAKIAKEAIEEIKNNINAFSIIPNERIFKIIDKTIALKKALGVVNKHLAKSIQGLIEVIYETGVINIDFADLETVFSGKGNLTYLNSVRIKKRDDKKELAKKIIESPLYSYSIEGGKNVLLNIAGQDNLSLEQVNNIADSVAKKVNKNAKIILGISKSKKKTISRVNLLVTGCGEEPRSTKKKKKTTKKKKTKSKKKKKKTKKKTRKKKKSTKKIVEKEKPKKIRKNAIEVKEDIKKAKEEIVSKENVWKTPAFLRKK